MDNNVKPLQLAPLLIGKLIHTQFHITFSWSSLRFGYGFRNENIYKKYLIMIQELALKHKWIIKQED